MKKTIFTLVYLAMIAIGVLLLAFNGQAEAALSAQQGLHGLVIATGIIFVVPGFILLLESFKPKRDASGRIVPRIWYVTAMAIAVLFWGIFMLCLSEGFLQNLCITLGVSVILAGLAESIWLQTLNDDLSARVIFYAIPIIAVCAGVIVITLINDYANVGVSGKTGCIVSGIVLLALGLNGLLSYVGSKKNEE